MKGGEKKMKKILVIMLVIVPLLGVVISPVFAEFLPTINFEGYAIGNIIGQDGWTNVNGVANPLIDQEVVSNTYGYSAFGDRTFRMSNAYANGSFGDWVFAKPLVDAVGEIDSTYGTFPVGNRQERFEMQFDIASAVPNAQQPGLQLSAAPDRGDGSRMSYLRFEDQSDGIHVIFFDVTDTGPLGTTATFNFHRIGIMNRSLPHTIKLTMDTLDGPGNDVVKVWIDSVLVKTGTSWEDYYRYDPESVAEPSPRIVRTVIFQARNVSAPATDGYGFLIDNLILGSGPSSVASPSDKNQCKNGGWVAFMTPGFKNQGDCVSYVQSNLNAIGNR